MPTIKRKNLPPPVEARRAAANSSSAQTSKANKTAKPSRDKAAEVCAKLSPQEELLQSAFKDKKNAEIVRLLNSGIQAKEQTLNWLLTAPISHATKLNLEAIANLEPFKFLYHLIHNPGINPAIFKTMLSKAVSTTCKLDDNMVVLADAEGECSKEKGQRFQQKLEASFPVFLLAPGAVNYQSPATNDHFLEKAKLRPIINPAWGKHLTEELRAKLLDTYSNMFSWGTNQGPVLTQTLAGRTSEIMQEISVAKYLGKEGGPTHKSYTRAIQTNGQKPYATGFEDLIATMFG